MRPAIIGNMIASVTNTLVTALRNHIDLNLTREEFRYSRISFSQFGEDLAILRWLDECFDDVSHTYVDAGCFHPIFHSNTLLLYKKGWRGINVDMLFSKIETFDRLRPGDKNVVAALSDRPREMIRCGYGYNTWGLTDRLAELGEADRRSVIGERLSTEDTVRTATLDQIIVESGLQIERIGYLNIDCEGHDLAVLKGLHLARYQPAIITIEALSREAKESIEEYLTPFGYSLKEVLYRTLLFVHSDEAFPRAAASVA
jgi:FkbM family methyltransferase